jgi:hypothetical protein
MDGLTIRPTRLRAPGLGGPQKVSDFVFEGGMLTANVTIIKYLFLCSQ